MRKHPRPLVHEPLEPRAVLAGMPFSVHLPPPQFAYDIEATPVAGGFRVAGLKGSVAVVDEFNAAGEATGQIHLTLPAGKDAVSHLQFSDDGRWIKGVALASGQSATSSEVFWKLTEPQSPLTHEQVPLNDRPQFSSDRSAANGRVVATVLHTALGNSPGITVDRNVQPIVGPDGQSFVGGVDFVVSGLGGDPTRWLAVGHADSNSSLRQFIAFSGGRAMNLRDFVRQQAGGEEPFHLGIDIDDVAVAHGSLLIASESSIGVCAPGAMVCLKMALLVNGVTVVPLPGDLAVPLTDDGAPPTSPYDIDNDGWVSPFDAVLIINALNYQVQTGRPVTSPGRIDVDGDSVVAPFDAVIVINHLNARGRTSTLIPVDVALFDESEGEIAAADSIDDNLLALVAYDLSNELAAERKHNAAR